MSLAVVLFCSACPFAAVLLQRRQLRHDVINEAERIVRARTDAAN